MFNCQIDRGISELLEDIWQCRSLSKMKKISKLLVFLKNKNDFTNEFVWHIFFMIEVDFRHNMTPSLRVLLKN